MDARHLFSVACLAATLVSPATADTVRTAGTSMAQAPVVPCTCRLDGRDVALGQQACIRGRMALCTRMLNNTSWKVGDAPCPLSLLDAGTGTPALPYSRRLP